MIAALTYDTKSAAQAQRLIDRIAQLGNLPTLLIFRESYAPVIEFHDWNPANKVTLTTYTDRVDHHPESKNIAFQSVAVYVAEMVKEPFLYLEADCVPNGSDWFTRIRTEYEGCKMPYMGPIVPESREHGSPRHMAAIAVYPWNLYLFGGGEALIANEEAFPAAMAPEMLKGVHPTTLIQHDWQGKGLDPSCALYHPDRDGKVLENLSQKSYSPEQISDLANSQPLPEMKRVESVVDEEGRIRPNLGQVFSASREEQKFSEEGHSLSSAVTDSEGRFLPNLGKTHPEPWENKLDSLERIKQLCNELSLFCTSPVTTGKVRNELAFARVITRAGKRRRRKKR